MKRDLVRLADTRFDLLIVGAGIYGATAAWDAALRGLSVAIVDRGDFGGATSFNSAKTVHGGVRSLQSGDIAQLREFVRERRILSAIAPHLVHPLPFLIPTSRHPARSRAAMRAYFALYDLLASDRNALPDPAKHLPASRLVSRAECLRLHPAIDPRGVTGGIIWHDCQMYSTDRVNLAFVLSAAGRGAVPANYVEAESLLLEGGRVAGVHARDVWSGERFPIRAALVLNAAGPWAVELLAAVASGNRRPIVPALSKAMNLVTRPIVSDLAVGGQAGSRFLFIAPWRNAAIVGTSHDPFESGADALSVTTREVESFLADVATAFPGAGFTLDDVRLVHRGLLPAAASARGVRLLKRSVVHDHRKDGIQGLLSVVGVRYTTARATAELAVDRAFSMLGRTPPPCRTASTSLEGGDMPLFDDFMREATAPRGGELKETARRRLALTYGTTHPQVLQVLRDPALARPLSAACEVTRGEILHAVRHEMAVRLADALLRRTEAGSAGHPGAEAVREAADVMRRELGWSDARARDELDAVESTYRFDRVAAVV